MSRPGGEATWEEQGASKCSRQDANKEVQGILTIFSGGAKVGAYQGLGRCWLASSDHQLYVGRRISWIGPAEASQQPADITQHQCIPLCI